MHDDPVNSNRAGDRAVGNYVRAGSTARIPERQNEVSEYEGVALVVFGLICVVVVIALAMIVAGSQE